MEKIWKIGIVKETSKSMRGLHGLHTAFRGLPNVDVIAHVDSNTDDIPQKMSYTKAKRHYATIDEMLDSESPDIVVLTSRHPYDHLEQIRKVAEKGCHIYCEKPICVDLVEADEIVSIIESNGIKCCVAHPARYGLAFRTMKQMVHAGDIGTPLTIYGRGKNDLRGGGEDLIVLGTHILDLETYFFGNPESVMADVSINGRPITGMDITETTEPIGPTAGDDIFACFRFPEGVRGIFESRRGWSVQPDVFPHMGITVIGTSGTLSMRFCDAATPVAQLRISLHPGPPEDESFFEEFNLKEDRFIPGAEPLDYSLSGQKDIPGGKWFLEANRFAAWDLIQAIEENRLPVSNIYNARQVVEMIQGIYSSQLLERRVHFPLLERKHPLDAPARRDEN